MIECIFTLDYEIYGDGTGSLDELVYRPARELQKIFQRFDARFVAFVEVAELEKIEAVFSDPAMPLIRKQVREFYGEGFEIGLHLHPQWCNARYVDNTWLLDYSEYNLCTLSESRIEEIVSHSLDYLAQLVGQPGFVPVSFRAGNWLFQPTRTAAAAMGKRGIKLDSSVFGGGLQRGRGLDYRGAPRNLPYWAFSSQVTVPDPSGAWMEIPIYTEMVPFWRMATKKRMAFSGGHSRSRRSVRNKINGLLDLARPRYPRKFDFCRMTLQELTSMVERVIEKDQNDPARYRPLVAIGHTKDLTDPGTVDAFLSYLKAKNIAVTTLEAAYARVQQGPAAALSQMHSSVSK